MTEAENLKYQIAKQGAETAARKREWQAACFTLKSGEARMRLRLRYQIARDTLEYLVSKLGGKHHG